MMLDVGVTLLLIALFSLSSGVLITKKGHIYLVRLLDHRHFYTISSARAVTSMQKRLLYTANGVGKITRVPAT